ncbi:hypothetical protein EDC61_12219 [Sulfuritortus calidifontis]|uniref:Uncharacterized protein n=1 Tax=Sulfuritortus calidifontis TaxID=1914471 RepID=A0A4R3JQ71_9PROT|nr:hypothetical protein [Sulfuritortus calidifontis]TCS69004.1 hypothetical protein EDC61_12219 [Sulfuritortus calidifontis]
MKFAQLPLGARFDFEGEVYVKTSPVAASNERGGQKLIPRYAVLKPLDTAARPAPKAARALDEARVLAAFEAFAADCARLIDAAGSDATQHRLARAELEAARRRFLESLGD